MEKSEPPLSLNEEKREEMSPLSFSVELPKAELISSKAFFPSSVLRKAPRPSSSSSVKIPPYFMYFEIIIFIAGLESIAESFLGSFASSWNFLF